MKTNLETDKEEFYQKLREINLNVDIKLNPYPKSTYFKEIDLRYKTGEPVAIVVLYNGLSCRVAIDNYWDTILVLNMDIFINSKEKDWNKLLHHLGIEEVEDNITRFTPDNRYIRYDKKFDSKVDYMCDYYNYKLNKEYPFEYPSNWFDVIELLIPRSGGPIGCDGKYMVAYMLAAPRSYLHYFDSKKTNEEIADDIFYDNL